MRRVKLGEICEINIGKTPSRSEKSFWNGEFCWLSISDMKSKFLSQTKEKITDKAINSTNMKIVRKGTVVMSFKLSIGKVAILSEDMYTNEAIANFIIKNNYDILTDYLYYALQSLKFDHLGDRAVMGKTLNKAKLNNLSIVFYEPNEQRKIVDKLDVISNLIDYRQKQFKELSNLVKSRFYEMFGDIFNTKFSMFKLEELCEFIKDGTHQTPKYTDDKINGFKFLSSKDVTSGKISWESIKYIPEDLHNELYSKIAPKRNDILLAKNGTTGVAALVDCDDIFDIYVSLAILRFHEGNNPKYLLYAINSDGTKWQFNSSLKGVGVPNLHLGEIRKTKIPLPPLALQNQFADFVAEVDKSQLAIKKSLEELETLKKSLMQVYFG